MDLGLKDRKALVTGGTKGIGRAIARQFAAEGAAVAICARDAAEVRDTVALLRGTGVPASGRALDVTDKSALEAWVREVAAEFGGLDIVVPNVSALAIPDDEAGWRAGFETDLMHSVRVVSAALPFLEQSDAAAIVIVSSVSGREIDFAAGPYGAFKAALIHYAQGLATNTRQRASGRTPSRRETPNFEGGVWQKIEQGNPELFKAALALNPTGRMGKPEEMARAVVFLASPAASFISGTNLVADGALTRGVQF